MLELPLLVGHTQNRMTKVATTKMVKQPNKASQLVSAIRPTKFIMLISPNIR